MVQPAAYPNPYGAAMHAQAAAANMAMGMAAASAMNPYGAPMVYGGKMKHGKMKHGKMKHHKMGKKMMKGFGKGFGKFGKFKFK